MVYICRIDNKITKEIIKNVKKFSNRADSYILLFTVVVGMSFFYQHFHQCNEKKLLPHSHIIFYYNTRIQSK